MITTDKLEAGTPLRIVFTSHCYKPAWRVGGPALSVSSLAEALTRRGHTVQVFTAHFNFGEPLDVPVMIPVEMDGVQVRFFPIIRPFKLLLPFVPYLSKAMGFLYSRAMRKALSAAIPSAHLVHTHLPFIYPTLAAAGIAASAQRPLFYHQRGLFDPARLRFRSVKKRLYLQLIERPILKQVTTLVALSESEMANYRSIGATAPCRVIPNGINTSGYRVQARSQTIANNGWSEQDLVVLFMSRLHPIKGADRLLDAFLLVANKHPSAHLVMAGPDEFEMERSLRQRLAGRDLAGRIHFPGMVTGDRKLDLLARADLFGLPSDAEGLSMSMLESLASGTAVLISPGCHFPAAVAAGAGVEVDPAVPTLAEALDELLSRGRAELAQMGRRGRDLVEREYGWDHIAERMEACYQEGLQRFSHRQSPKG
jgi:glycosyltransferase involved in cell wall biosynthesis